MLGVCRKHESWAIAGSEEDYCVHCLRQDREECLQLLAEIRDSDKMDQLNGVGLDTRLADELHGILLKFSAYGMRKDLGG
ncbi:MAG: hypothetical protein GY737_00180 [Desulfobacteraceae bacterium]|nr:hypothetical protein [Desulfobacteraceae bacterium]